MHASIVVGLSLPAAASAQSISSEDWSEPWPGVRLLEGQTSSPTTQFYAAFANLCADGVYLDATSAPSSRRTAGSWGSSAGARVAVNGDFFRTDQPAPTVYGSAVGGGSAWPLSQTGDDPSFSDDWYYQKHGWIAVGSGWVELDHSEWVKNNLDVTLGWQPGAVTQDLPGGARALVSGFPELVTEGEPVTCGDPTASSCFPDRTDMRTRNPRTAMGLTEDRRTMMLVVVDGRSTSSAGMYGTELAWLMGELGAWQAYNLDGGGSSQMWVDGRGTISDPSDGSPRSVANHWGIFTGGGAGQQSCFTYGGCFPTRVPGAEGETFVDLAPDMLGYREANILFREGITNGCKSDAPRMFCPKCPITRRQMVVFLVKAAGIDTSSPPATPSFSDVPADHWSYPFVEAAAEAGITSGCGGDRFCPNDPVTRGQAAAFITRTLGWSPLRPDTPTFSDVPADHLFYGGVERIAERCVTNGCGDGRYCPDREMTRAEAAVFIARAFDLEDINDCIGEAGGDGGPGGVDGGPGSTDGGAIDRDGAVADSGPDDGGRADGGRDDGGPDDGSIGGGCSCRATPTRFGAWWLGLALAALMAARRRRP